MDPTDRDPIQPQETTDPIAVLRAAIEPDAAEEPTQSLSLPQEAAWQIGRTGWRRLRRAGAGFLGLLLLLFVAGALRSAATDRVAQGPLPAAADPVNTPLPTPTLLPDPDEYNEPLLAAPRDTPIPSPTPLPPLPTPDFIVVTAPPP